MIVSMTGYHYATQIIGGVEYSLQIKTLNSKILDLSIKSAYENLDSRIKALVKKILKRGKVDIYLKNKPVTQFSKDFLDTEKIELYIHQLQKISPNSSRNDLLKLAFSLPGLHTKKPHKLSRKSEKELMCFIQETLFFVLEHRKKEGRKMERELRGYLKKISNQLKKIKFNEKSRIKPKRKKIEKKLKTFNLKIDKSRLEQEMIFYLEKIDITEELVRLDSHCSYFLELISKEDCAGRKLNFLCQEMLREVNTIGSKSSDFKLQKSVILIKEELEKIKEQVQNAL